jgi:hypothetical protein
MSGAAVGVPQEAATATTAVTRLCLLLWNTPFENISFHTTQDYAMAITLFGVVSAASAPL